jgi:hypothetical protein
VGMREHEHLVTWKRKELIPRIGPEEALSTLVQWKGSRVRKVEIVPDFGCGNDSKSFLLPYLGWPSHL